MKQPPSPYKGRMLETWNIPDQEVQECFRKWRCAVFWDWFNLNNVEMFLPDHSTWEETLAFLDRLALEEEGNLNDFISSLNSNLDLSRDIAGNEFEDKVNAIQSV